MDKREKYYRDYWEEEMEIGQDWSVLDEDLMLSAGNHYLQQDEIMRLVENIHNRTKYRYSRNIL